MVRIILPALGALLLAGCASYAPTIPAGYTGPTATLEESGMMNGRGSGELFYVETIDGRAVLTGKIKTQQENQGRGMSLRLAFVNQTVPADRPLKLKLVGTTMTGAPIHAIALSATGKFHETSKEVTFTPEPGGVYRVRGRLMPQNSDIWLEDVKTFKRVTP